MILDNIPHNASLFIKKTPLLYTYLLSNRNLHVIYIAPVPEWFKNTISKAEKNDILNCFLA